LRVQNYMKFQEFQACEMKFIIFKEERHKFNGELKIES